MAARTGDRKFSMKNNIFPKEKPERAGPFSLAQSEGKVPTITPHPGF